MGSRSHRWYANKCELCGLQRRFNLTAGRRVAIFLHDDGHWREVKPACSVDPTKIIDLASYRRR